MRRSAAWTAHMKCSSNCARRGRKQRSLQPPWPDRSFPYHHWMQGSLAKRAAAEFAGTCLLVAAVIGSGIMGERLAGGNVAIALLANTIATGAALVALILTFGPISGAHFNPAVTVADFVEGRLASRELVAYAAAQLCGAFIGV